MNIKTPCFWLKWGINQMITDPNLGSVHQPQKLVIPLFLSYIDVDDKKMCIVIQFQLRKEYKYSSLVIDPKFGSVHIPKKLVNPDFLLYIVYVDERN